MEAFTRVVIADMLLGIFSDGVASRTLSEQVLEHGLHLWQWQPLFEPIELDDKSPKFIDEDTLF
jgi:hypothetical protein